MQVDDLRHHNEDQDRFEAIAALDAALYEAERKIDLNPAIGLTAPRPYPDLARPGRKWIKAGRYWIAYSDATSPAIVGVFYETANIPGRV